MAKDTTQAPREGGSGLKNVAVWIMLIMLIIGLGGFGITSFGGNVTKVGSVGGRAISTDDYARALQTEVRAFSEQFGAPLTMEQATALGIDRRALGALVNETALDVEAARVGLSVGDARLAAELADIPAFHDASGKFDRAAYTDTLDRNQLSAAEFEDRLRESLARGLLQGSVAGGIAAPKSVVDTLHAFVAERRGFSMLRLTEADLATQPVVPDDAALTAYYTENIARFTKPEAKRITYAALLPDALAPDMPVDDAALQKLYDSRIDEFVAPEKRIVEQLVYPDDAAATAAKAKLDAGATFEELVAERGLTLDAIDLGDVAEAELGEAGPGVFGLSEPGIVGPLKSPIGPAIYRMNAVLPAQNVTLDEVRDDLAKDLQIDSARRAIGDRVEELDDMIAAGASLEDLAKEKDLTLATVDYASQAPGDAGILGYAAFRETADTVEEGVASDVIVLEDGGLVALRLDEIVPAAPIPFAEARADVAASWLADAKAKALTERAIAIKSEVEGGASLGTFGIVDVSTGIARDNQVADAPASLLTTVFEMAAGDVRVVDEAGFVAVVKLDTVTPAPTDDAAATAIKAAIGAQLQQAISTDTFDAFTSAVGTEAGIELDQNAINAVHTQLP
jgi:peptidyl-prolyl cis-trans isomerase D